MTVLTDADQEFIRARLSTGYIQALAQEIGNAVAHRGRPLAVAYQPGDGTSYRLVFTPLDLSPITERAHVRRGWESKGEKPDEVIRTSYPIETGLGIGEPDGRFALVSLVEHGAYPFELFTTGKFALPSGAYFDPGYVGEKLGIQNAASAIAITELLNEIARVP